MPHSPVVQPGSGALGSKESICQPVFIFRGNRIDGKHRSIGIPHLYAGCIGIEFTGQGLFHVRLPKVMI